MVSAELSEFVRGLAHSLSCARFMSGKTVGQKYLNKKKEKARSSSPLDEKIELNN